MRFTLFAIVAGLATIARAHFQLAFPAPRGPFVEDNEPTFCDNYADATSNRTVFPLSDGFITLNSEHPQWTLGVEISTVQNPNSFDNFTSNGQDQLVRQFATGNGEGGFCIPLPLNNTGVSGVQNGANVTIQIIFDGGDGKLYQCADLTLSGTATIPSNVTCSNATTSTSTSSTASVSPSASSTPSSSSLMVKSPFVAPVLLLAGFIAVLV